MMLSSLMGTIWRKLRKIVRGKSPSEIEDLLKQGFHQQELGDYDGARRSCALILAQAPENGEAYSLLGMIDVQCGNLDSAERHFRKATTLKPEAYGVHVDLGNVYRLQRKSEAAEACYRRALSLNPGSAVAHFNFGLLLLDLGNRVQALKHLRQAHFLAPDRGDMLTKLVHALLENHCDSEAVQVARAAAQKSPESYEAQLCLGFALQKTYAFAEALACYDKALRLKQDDSVLYNNRAIVLQNLGRFQEAFAAYDHALELRPDFSLAKSCRALARLLIGDYGRGWNDYEARLLTKDAPARPASYRRWNGEPLAGRTLLIYGEQGLGDEIMFASCLPQVIEEAGHCVIECAPKLAGLFARSFPQATVYPAASDGQIPDWIAARGIEVEVPIGSLPLYYRRTVADFPEHHGYLTADRYRASRWRDRLNALGPDLKVGISWRGGTYKTAGPIRSVDIERWLPIFKAGRARFISLQYTEGAEREVLLLREKHGVDVIHWPEAIEDYEETAALMTVLDLTISVCTAVVHLAGALGKSVWILVPYNPDWCFGFAGESMPWYPTARLFRQESDRNWEPVIHRVAEELAGLGEPRDSARVE